MPAPDHAIIVGAGLAGLVAAYELTQQNVPVVILDQENRSNLGGQAFWSLGGIFCVNSTDQRRAGIKDSAALARQDWADTAGFDREREDFWPRQWADAFVEFAEKGMESYLKGRGVSFLTVGWAERGGSGGGAVEGGDGGDGRVTQGNSVPRFHLTWGTGPAVMRAFEEPVLRAEKRGLVTFMFRHMVDEIITDPATGAAVGVRGSVLEETDAERGVASSRKVVDTFELRGRAVLISTGGIGGNIQAVKDNWPLDRLGPKVPDSFVVGVPAHVDGRGVQIAQRAGASVINLDRMWHYTEGLTNWNPIWPNHGIRIIPGPSSLWLDATGRRLPPPLYPGANTLETLRHICAAGHSYSWFILNRAIISREFTLSGSEQNPDITGKSYLKLLQRYFTRHGIPAVQAFMQHGSDFVVKDSLHDLVAEMNKLAAARNGPSLNLSKIEKEIEARDAQMDNNYSKDAQLMLIENARRYARDRARIAPPHRILDPACGPLVAVRLNLLTRKSLGGLETNLDSQVMRGQFEVFEGLFAAGEAAGFGGGGVHGYSALEGTFLGGCVFSGLRAGRAMAGLFEGAGRRARL
jgi:predicted oxidoreductase